MRKNGNACSIATNHGPWSDRHKSTLSRKRQRKTPPHQHLAEAKEENQTRQKIIAKELTNSRIVQETFTQSHDT